MDLCHQSSPVRIGENLGAGRLWFEKASLVRLHYENCVNVYVEFYRQLGLFIIFSANTNCFALRHEA
jgi:hypothetical protein